MVLRDVVVFVHHLVVFLSLVLVDLSQGGLWEDAQEVPCNVQTLEDGSDVVRSLADELVLELLQEFEVQQILGGESFLTDDGLHSLSVLSDSVVGVELGQWGLPGWTLLDGHLWSCLFR